MDKSKLNKSDKKYLIITIIIGFVANFFIESGMDIAILVFFIYISHKYMASTKNSTEYFECEFTNKYKYERGRKLIVLLSDVYILIRIIYLLFNPQHSNIFGELILIAICYGFYENYLNEKYLLNANIFKTKATLVFIRNKAVVIILMCIFGIFTYLTFNTLHDLDLKDHIKYGKYEYNLSNLNDTRKIEINIGSRYMMGEENNENSAHFDDFLAESKNILKDKIFKTYVFILMLFMVLLCFVELYPKDNTINSVVSNIFLIVLILSSIFVFNYDTINKENNLASYFHSYISK